MTTPFKIYDRPGFPNPARIRIVLAAKGLDSQVDYISIDLIGAEHKQPAYLAINPSGTIPAMELPDGTFLTESTAITEYLDNLDGNPILTGTTPKEKAIVHMLHKRAETELLEPVGHYFHYATPGLGAALLPFKSPEWSGRAEWGQREGKRAQNAMVAFNAMLANQPYLVSSTFSMADITLLTGLMFADAAGLKATEDLPHLAAWRTRVENLPAVKNRTGQAFLPEDLKRLGY